MATGDDLRSIALSLNGTSEAPHFDRVAFKAARIYATLAAGGASANLKLTPEDQELECLAAPHAFSPVANAWGKQGWTTASLAALTISELRHALELAWRNAAPIKRTKRNVR